MRVPIGVLLLLDQMMPDKLISCISLILTGIILINQAANIDTRYTTNITLI